MTVDLQANGDMWAKMAVMLFRLSQSWPQPLAGLFQVVLHVVCGCSLPRTVQAGPGLRLPHGGRGLVIHPGVTLGSDVTLYHGVTLGIRGGPGPQVPTLGDQVYVGAGAVILGGVRIGDGAKVGANAVVTSDVPAGCTAVGNPATVLSQRAA